MVWMIGCGAVIGGCIALIIKGNKRSWPWAALVLAVIGIALSINLLMPIQEWDTRG